MAEYYITGLQAYLEALATQHYLLLHDPQPGGQKSFVRFQTPDDLDQITNNPGTNLLVVSRFNGKSIGDMSDEMMRQHVVLRFACYAHQPLDGNIAASISDALDRAFTIMMDFLARFRKDMTDDDCGPLKGLELDQITWDEIPEQPWLQNHFGWDLSMPYRSEMPPFDPAAWEEGTIPPILYSGVDNTPITFEVGPGAPMEDGAGILVNERLIGRRVMVFIDGTYIQQIANPAKRYIIKITASDTLQIIGGVANGEAVAIYFTS